MAIEVLDRPQSRSAIDGTVPAGWYGDIGDVIAHIGKPGLPSVLDRTLRRLVSFDFSVIFAYPKGVRPLHLHNGLSERQPGAALDAYLDGAYLLDPFYVACSQPVPPALYRMKDLAPDAFFEGQYVNNWEVHPCISMESGSLSEEIGYIVDLPGGVMAAYSLMREAGSPAFSDADFRQLAKVEPIVRQAVRGHWHDPLAAGQVPRLESGFGRGRVAVLDHAFASFQAGLLSMREKMVTQLILRGHSTHSIADLLGIAEGTVKNHRKSIYAKLEIASQQELFSLFLSHVLA